MFAVDLLAERRSIQLLVLAFGILLGAGPGSSDEYYQERAVWDRLTGGQLNISAFAFRDTNRNGIYDMADHPMAGIAFEVTGDGRTISRRTNKSGFGNVAMSAQDSDKDIVNPGEYTFVAMIPNGWLLTTANMTQTSVFEAMPGAPADLVSSTPFEPVGLAQEFTITGRVSRSAEAALARLPAAQAPDHIRVRAISPEGDRQEVAVDQAGLFSFAVTPGNWTILGEDRVGNVLGERPVTITVTPILLAALVPEEDQSEATQQSVLVNFDDLVTGGIKEIPFGYHGLNWHNWVATHHKFYDGEGYVNTTMSGEFVAYNSSGHPVKISREQPFDFLGGYFGAAWLRQAEGETLRVKGWRDDVLAYDENIKLSALGPVYFSANFQSITSLEFATQRYWQFVVDDLEFVLPN